MLSSIQNTQSGVEQALLKVQNLSKLYERAKVLVMCLLSYIRAKSWALSENRVLEKANYLQSISGRLKPDNGEVLYLQTGSDKANQSSITQLESLYEMTESQRRHLLRTEWAWCISTLSMGLPREYRLVAILASV